MPYVELVFKNVVPWRALDGEYEELVDARSYFMGDISSRT